MENSVSNDFGCMFVDGINVFDCRLLGVFSHIVTQFSFSGFEGQNQPMFFQGSAENLQSQLEQGNNSENEATSHINITNVHVSTAGTDSVPTTMEELSTHIQSNVQMLATGTEHIDSATMDVSTESMPVNQSAPSSQSENVLHVDFHVAQPGNLLQMVKQAEDETAKIEQTG